jgi:hypothetical protein
VECDNKEAGVRISKVINNWIELLRRQNPNPFKETVKNMLGRGESYIKVVHNKKWLTNPIGKYNDGLPLFDRSGLPVLFPITDPMIVYGSPEEDINGTPERVVLYYKRHIREVVSEFPQFDNKVTKGKKTVSWVEYWDADTVYLEIDGEQVTYEINPYKVTPFIRRYSGFGRRSPEGELADLIVSDIRHSRGLIEEICLMRSDIASTMHLSSHKPKTIMSTGEINDKQLRENLKFDSYALNILDNLPADFKIVDEQIDQPTMEAFQHVANIQAELYNRHPYIQASFPSTTSGRQYSMTELAASKRYDTVVENTETMWATAFETAFHVLRFMNTLGCDIEGLHKGDIKLPFRCSLRLKAKDPIEEDRLITLGDRLRRLPNPAIDIETFHTQFMGYTQDESRQIMAKMLADMVTIYNPDIASVMGMVAAEESSMAEWLQKAKARRQQMEQQQAALQGKPSNTEQQRMMGEVETQTGNEMGVESNRGARRPPERYTRGG